MAKAPAGRPAGVPKPYLRAGSNVYQVKVKVPKGAGGPVQIARSLNTRDWAEACRRAPLVVAEIRREIETRRRRPDGTRTDQLGDLTAEQRKLAAWWAERRVPDPNVAGRYRIPPELVETWDATIDGMLGDPVEADNGGGESPTFAPEREAAVQALIGLTTGERVPVSEELDRYIAQQGLTASYESRTRSAVRKLEAWLGTQPGGDNLHAVTGRVADKFADTLSDGRTTATLNSLISALSAYWTWMRRRQIVSDNPWKGQERKALASGMNAEKRPFSDEEIVALLSGPASPTLLDMMRVAALSGMRLAEIGNLRVADASGGVFRIEQGKTKAAKRLVPIHSDLAAIVARRTAGKAPEDYLIEELTAPPSRPGRRGGKIGERFTAYRRDLGLDHRKADRRQADADFHSFRRWFVTKAEQAGQRESLIQAVVGHKREGVTLGVYSAGPSVEQRRELVESVRLPNGVSAIPPANGSR